MGAFISYYFNSNLTQQHLIDYQNDYLDQNCDNSYDENCDNSYHTSDKDVYILYIYIDPSVSSQIKDSYITKANQHNSKVDKFLNINHNSVFSQHLDMNDYCFDAGFDLFNVIDENITKTNAQSRFNIVLDHNVKCAMKFNNYYVSYYLYPRSSTGTKTPLRLSNSVGIIDSGYRGNIKAAFDINLAYFHENNEFNIESNSRYVQITPPDLSNYPMKVIIVDSIDDLGGTTSRGDSGFGSSGQ